MTGFGAFCPFSDRLKGGLRGIKHHYPHKIAKNHYSIIELFPLDSFLQKSCYFVIKIVTFRFGFLLIKPILGSLISFRYIYKSLIIKELSLSINIAVAGMGYWGKNLVRNFHQLGVLHSVCDSNPAVEGLLKEQYSGVKFTGDYSALLNDPDINAIVLATPAVTHFKQAKEALEAGKDVYVEKPLSVNTGDGVELVKLAANKGRILMVGHILQYHPAVMKLKKFIDDGVLGQVQYIYSNRLSMGKIRTEENILWSFAPHDISVILRLLEEEPKEVSCQGGAYVSDKVADVTLSEFCFPSGVRAHIFVSWLHPFKEQRLVVVGSEKMAVFEDTSQDKLKLYPLRVEWKNRIPTAVKSEGEVVPLEPAEPLKNECSHFIECVENRRTPLTDGEEGLRVLKVLSRCQKSMETGITQYLDATKKPAPAKKYFAHETAVVDEPCEIGEGTKIWHFSHVMPGAKIGKKCIFGQNCNIDRDVIIGNNVKVQNNISIYTGVEIEDDVFLGPSCVLTNVTNPRSQVLRHSLYEKTLLKRGCSVGANATIVCGITVGRYSFIGAGAVVSADVPDYALMLGVPAKQKGWMSRHGQLLKNPDAEGIMICPESNYRYQEAEPGVLRCLDLDEESPLPEELTKGEKTYDDFKKQKV
ncbi:MAG: Gfo/Idh/MocA family oxidoreductase [FCB group bacterium]|nr:Gfo/Idh/MocA family oxidoreductase [FCB group bacterium]